MPVPTIMPRYILTQEQLDRLQQQIEELKEIYDVKEKRIKELELRNVAMADNKAADLMEMIMNLEDEISELKKENRHLAKIYSAREDAAKIQELQMMLDEERKLREYSEAFARQVELRRAEESLIKDLTTELCHLQRAEIELGNKKIDELQRKFKFPYYETLYEKKIKQIGNTSNDENFMRNTQLKVILEELKAQLTDLYESVQRNPTKTQKDKIRMKEMEDWLKEIDQVMTDLSDIEDMRKDLKHLKDEIELRKKLTVGYRN